MTPSCQRSLEEVVQTSYIADALGMSLYEALKHGDEWHKSDAAFHLDCGVVLTYEHDPVWWHPDSRMQGDCDKTEKLLRYENTLVVRGRFGATELPIQHPRLVQLMVDSTMKPERFMYEFARAVHDRLPEPHQSKLRDVGDKKRTDVEAHASTVFRHIHPDYDTKLRERQAFLEEHGLTVDAAKIVSMPLSTLRTTMDHLLTLGISKTKIATHSTLLTRDSETLRQKTEWLLHHGFDWTKDPMLLASNLDRMKASLDFLLNVGISRQSIKKRHVSRLTQIQMERKYTHASFSIMDEKSKLRMFFAR